MKANMTIGKRMFLAGLVPLALMAVLGVVALLALSTLTKTMTGIISGPLPGVLRAAEIDSLVFQFRGDTWKHISNASPEAKSKVEANQQKVKQRVEEDLREFEKTVVTAEDRAAFLKVDPIYQRYVQLIEGVVLPLSRDGKQAEAVAAYVKEVDPVHAELKAALRTLITKSQTNGDSESAEATAFASMARAGISGLILISTLGAGIFVFLSVRNVNRILRQVVEELSGGADQVAAASAQVAISSQSLANGASQQAAALEETSASGEEINSMARTNSGNTQAAAGLMAQSLEKFVLTNKALKQTVKAMGEIDAQSGKIFKIIKVIDEIAFQTNILALNAAVEAARAGESGLGFAVVAGEVRNLAQRCAQAAQDTATLIEESLGKSKDGKARVDNMAVDIEALSKEAAQVRTLVDEVNTGSQEQARGMEQIGKAMTRMERLTQTTAANAEEGAAAAAELKAQSDSMKNTVVCLSGLVS